MIRISPSLAAAPMGHLAQVIAELDAADVDMIHFDIEDGSFAPVMTLGTRIIQQLRPLTKKIFDVHLMMVSPEWIIPQLIGDGAGRISVHYEACPYPRRTLRLIKEQGAAAGLAFNPATPLPDLHYLQPYLDFVVVLSTEPEVPDSPHLPEVLEKVVQGRRHPALRGVEWVVDGGVNQHNIRQVAGCGADTLVIGRAVFEDERIVTNIDHLRALLKEAEG